MCESGILVYCTIPLLCCSHVAGALFGFREFDGTSYRVNEDQESLEVNVGLIEGQLARDVTLLLTTSEQGQSAIGELLCVCMPLVHVCVVCVVCVYMYVHVCVGVYV